MSSNCPFCDNARNVSTVFENTYFNEKEFEYRKCSQCNLIYVQPFPNNEDYIAMYPPAYQGDVIAETLFTNAFNEIEKLIVKFTVKKKLLDYGCGNGSFVLPASEKKFNCLGVEFSDSLVKTLSEKIKNVSFQTIKEFENTNEKFDIIHISNVLEHLTNPREIMQQLKLRLTDGGIFIIYGPVENNLNLALMVRKCFFYTRKFLLKRRNSHAPTHIFYSNSLNQRMFFKGLGIEELFYKVQEGAWPFPSDLTNSKGLVKKIMYYIAQLSILISKTNKKLGNNFIYIGRVKK